MQFTNWAKNLRFEVAHYHQPDNEAALVELVQRHRRVRLVGSGHSWSPLCLTDEALINLDRYNRVLDIDRERLRVRVQAGIKLWQLNEALDREGLALANLGSIDQQSISGAMATGTHGTGKAFQILASQATAIKWLLADGSTRRIEREQEPDLFDLTAVHLGALGLVLELELAVVPAFRLEERTQVQAFEATLDQLDELLDTTDHLKFWWFGHTDKLIVYRYQRTDAPRNDSRLRQWFMDELISVAIYRSLVRLGNLRRDWRQGINRTLLRLIRPLHRIEKSYLVYRVPKPPLHRETEWAVDLRQAKTILSEYTKWINASTHRLNFIQEFRFSKADSFALSPAYQRDTLWLSGYNIENGKHWDAFRQDVEQFARSYQGRPHWGKEFDADGAYLQSVYPRWADFLALRQTWDPEQKFINDWLEKLFNL